MNLKYIFKILDKGEWKKAKNNGVYSGSSKDLKDGYIHFSEEDQVSDTLKKYFYKDFELFHNILGFTLKINFLNS